MFFPFSNYKRIRVDGSGGGSTLQYTATATSLVSFQPDTRGSLNTWVRIPLEFYLFRSTPDGGSDELAPPSAIINSGDEVYGQNGSAGYLHVFELPL